MAAGASGLTPRSPDWENQRVTTSGRLTTTLFLALLWGIPALASDASRPAGLPVLKASTAAISEAPLPAAGDVAWSDRVLDSRSPDAPRLLADPWGPLHERIWFIRPVRFALGTLAGAAGAIAGLLPGGLLGLAMTMPVGMVLGAGVGAVFGTWLSGNLLGGDGDFWATLGGTALGAGTTLVLTATVMGSGQARMGPFWIPSVVGTSLLPFVAGALFYELTSRTSAASSRDSDSARFGLERASVSPALLPGRDGAAMGLALSGTWR